MKRRQLLQGMAALATLPVLQPAIAGGGFVDYTPELYAEALASKEPFLLGILSDW